MGNAALDGIRADAGEEYEMLKEVFESNAFELQIRPGTEGVYDVPYMLNDALECYLVFTGARLQGKFLDGMEEDTTGSLLEEDGRGCTQLFRQLSVHIVVVYRLDDLSQFRVAQQIHRGHHVEVKNKTGSHIELLL